MTHQHTCVECGARTLCTEDELECAGSDGDGRCAKCTEAAFDAIGTDRRYRCSE